VVDIEMLAGAAEAASVRSRPTRIRVADREYVVPHPALTLPDLALDAGE
jgi:hypothetical protein